MARPERVELPTFWFVARRSIQLSYGRAKNSLTQSLSARLLARQSLRAHFDAVRASISRRSRRFTDATWTDDGLAAPPSLCHSTLGDMAVTDGQSLRRRASVW